MLWEKGQPVEYCRNRVCGTEAQVRNNSLHGRIKRGSVSAKLTRFENALREGIGEETKNQRRVQFFDMKKWIPPYLPEARRRIGFYKMCL